MPPRNILFRIAVVAILFAAVGITAAKYYAKAQKPSSLGTQTRTAFLRWRPQIQGLDTGVNIYTAYAYPNPPVMALVLTPFAKLPPLPGAMLWFAFKVILAGFTALWAFRLAGPAMPDWAKASALALGLHPVLGDLAHGNVNIFVGFVVVAALELFRRRMDFSCGVVLALAIACKVTPALFLPYFVWKRAWRAVAGCAVGMVLWLAVVPAGVLGWDYNRELLTSWFEVMVKPFVVDGKVTTEHANQSVPGLTFRLLTREPSFVGYDEDDKPFGADFHTIVDIGPGPAKILVKVVMAAFGLVVILTCRWRTWDATIPRAGPAFAAECGLILLGMLLFSERTWKHHAVTLVVPFAALTAAAAAGIRRKLVVGVLVAAAGLMIVPSLLMEDAQDLALVYGTHTALFVILAAGTAVVATGGRPSGNNNVHI